uniref:Uncharacterized protein n=1 Tax=Solanum lycopersicum TaxID=4081 RepID=A0A3Q7FII8_SOLLC
MLGLDRLVRSHSKISVGATRDPFWVVTMSSVTHLNNLKKMKGRKIEKSRISYSHF